MILMDFSYFFLLFSGFLEDEFTHKFGLDSFWAGFGVLFGEFLRFQLLFSALFRIFGRVWGAVLWISAVSATFFRIFWRVWGAVWGISAVSAPQGPLAMLPTYGYCTL